MVISMMGELLYRLREFLEGRKTVSVNTDVDLSGVEGALGDIKSDTSTITGHASSIKANTHDTMMIASQINGFIQDILNKIQDGSQKAEVTNPYLVMRNNTGIYTCVSLARGINALWETVGSKLTADETVNLIDVAGVVFLDYGRLQVYDDSGSPTWRKVNYNTYQSSVGANFFFSNLLSPYRFYTLYGKERTGDRGAVELRSKAGDTAYQILMFNFGILGLGGSLYDIKIDIYNEDDIDLNVYAMISYVLPSSVYNKYTYEEDVVVTDIRNAIADELGIDKKLVTVAKHPADKELHVSVEKDIDVKALDNVVKKLL